MKKEFQTPEIEIINFSAEDVMTTSDHNIGDTDWDWDKIVKPWDFYNLRSREKREHIEWYALFDQRKSEDN